MLHTSYMRKRSTDLRRELCCRLMERLKSSSDSNRWMMMSVANDFLLDCGLMNMIASYFLHSITHTRTQPQNHVKFHCDEMISGGVCMNADSLFLGSYYRWDRRRRAARLLIWASFLFPSQVTTFCQLEALITAGVSSEINIRASHGERLLWSDGEDRKVKEKV